MKFKIIMEFIRTLTDKEKREKLIYIIIFILFFSVFPLFYIAMHPIDFGLSLLFGDGEGQTENISQEVLRYQSKVEKYASEFGVSEYVPLMLALIQQESGGNYLDVMQSAEGAYNTRYPKIQNGILDPDYSIWCGVQEFRDAIKRAGVTGPNDIQNISLALQTYNFGPGFLAFARSRGGYSPEVAQEFSNIKAVESGWPSYGDPQYVQHVLRYYSSTPASSNQVVIEAKKHLGSPYVWGAEGPDTFDCSGLVYYAYKESGYKIGRTTAQGFHDLCQPIATPEPGDLVFFRNSWDKEDHHIGIYIGDNKMIHAPKTGDVVKISEYLNRPDFVGYGRLKVN